MTYNHNMSGLKQHIIEFIYLINRILMPPAKIMFIFWTFCWVVAGISDDTITFFEKIITILFGYLLFCGIADLIYFCFRKKYLDYQLKITRKKLDRLHKLLKKLDPIKYQEQYGEVYTNNINRHQFKHLCAKISLLLKKSNEWGNIMFKKLLDILNMDNWENKEKCFSHKTDCHMQNQNAILSLTEKRLLISIKRFWQKTPYSYERPSYRTPSLEEMQEFATTQILHCFTKARALDDFSDYSLNQLGITNWNKFSSKLLQNAYICRANTIDILNYYTLETLKTMAEEFGIKKTGKKSELAERIYCSLSPEEAEDIIETENLFIITEKGQKYIDSNKDYILLEKYKKYNISLSEFNDHRIPDGTHKRTFYDTVFQVLSDRIFSYQCSRNYNLLPIEHLHTFEIMMDEYKYTEYNVPLDVALSHYVEYLYLMSCFPLTAYNTGVYNTTLHDFNSFILPKPHKDIYKLYNYKHYINYDAIFINNPPSFFTQNEFIEYINDIFNSPMFDFQKWNQLLQNRLYNYSKLK